MRCGPELQRLNREFRRKDYPTDVLSFPSRQTLGFLGDVAVFPSIRPGARPPNTVIASTRRSGFSCCMACCICWAWIMSKTVAGWLGPKTNGAKRSDCRTG